MRFILIRHPETIANRDGKYIGISKSEYTSRGKNQLNKVVDNLEELSFEKIYTSPLPRTRKLADNIFKKYDKELIIEEALIEMNFGIFENKTFKEVQNIHKEEWNIWTKDYVNYRVPKGENLTDVYERVVGFLKVLISNDKDCVIVTHGGIVHTIITYLLDLQINDRWHFRINPASITIIDYENGYGILSGLIN